MLCCIPKDYLTVHIVDYSYRTASIKNAERIHRGDTSKIFVKSATSNIPRDFKEFLRNCENKKRMIDLFFNFIEEKRREILSYLHSTTSEDGECKLVTSDGSASKKKRIQRWYYTVTLHCLVIRNKMFCSLPLQEILTSSF